MLVYKFMPFDARIFLFITEHNLRSPWQRAS